MSSPHSPRQNHLLAAVPAQDVAHFSPHFELVPLRLGDVLYENGMTLRNVFFPTTALVSLRFAKDENDSVEMTLVGNEGLVGIPLFIGGTTTSSQAVVQRAGYAYRLKWNLIKDEFYRAGPMQRLLLLYAQTLLTQLVQTTVCKRHHTLEQRISRWLLLSLERLPCEPTTPHDLIADALGVSRESIAEVAGRLQKAGLITYQRGRIGILDRAGLEDGVCECYGVIKKAYGRLRPEVINAAINRPRLGRLTPPGRLQESSVC